jgi:GINS complex subunit 2
MNPAEVEFLAENQTIQITPNFSHDRLYLICGEVGPFRPGIPVQVPLWMAINLKQRQKCRLTSPEWMTVETLTKIKEDEGQSKTFTPMPDEHYMVTTQLILGAAPHDIPNTDEIRILVKVVFFYIECIQQINNYDCLQDIWDMRIAKLRSSVDAFLKIGGSLAKVDHLTLMEINTVRPFLPHALDQLFRLRQVV